MLAVVEVVVVVVIIIVVIVAYVNESDPRSNVFCGPLSVCFEEADFLFGRVY